MTSQDAETTRYYRSFSAYQHPLCPVGEITLEEALNLITFYEAVFSADQKILSFKKQIRCKENETYHFDEMFIEQYQYDNSGELLSRKLTTPGEKDQIWYYKSLSAPSLNAHNQFNQLEDYVYSHLGQKEYDELFIYTGMTLFIEGVKQILEMATSSNIRVCAAAENPRQPIPLKGFDEPEPNLFGIIEDWKSQQPALNSDSIFSLTPQYDFDRSTFEWAENVNIKNIVSVPIKAQHSRSIDVVGEMLILSNRRLDVGASEILKSIAIRLAHQMLVLSRISLAHNDTFDTKGD